MEILSQYYSNVIINYGILSKYEVKGQVYIRD